MYGRCSFARTMEYLRTRGRLHRVRSLLAGLALPGLVVDLVAT